MNLRGGFRHELGRDLGIDYIEAKIKEDDQGKWDAIVPVEDISFDVDGRIVTPDGSFEMTDNAKSQFFSRLGIPVNYAVKCPPHMLIDHVDHWKAKYQESVPAVKSWLIRGKNDKVRAVLTDNYSIFDNKHVLESIKRASLNTNFNVVFCDVDDESFHLRLTSPRLSKDFGTVDGRPDTFWGGVHLSNKEIGGASTKAEYILFRLICSNGLVGVGGQRNAFRRVHRGFKNDPVDIFIDRLGQVVSGYEKNITNIFEKLETTRDEFTYRGKDLTRYIGTRLGLGHDRSEAAAHFIENDTKQFRLDIINAFSEAAHNFSGDQRYQMEAVAGDLVTRSIAPFEIEMIQKEIEELRQQRSV